MNLDNVCALSIRDSKDLMDSFFISESGSSLSGKNKNLITIPDLITGKAILRAFHAAALPARSPSKQKIIRF